MAPRFLLLLAIFTIASAAQVLTRTQVIMGTFVSVSLQREDAECIEGAFDVIKDVDDALSSYKPSADIFSLNADKKTALKPLSYEALNLSKRFHQESDGYFDITVGSITKELFHFGEEQERVPTPKELLDAKVEFNGLSFTKENAWLKPGVKVDLGGMGKGFAVDKAVEFLREKKVKDGVIAASGDIRCLSSCKIDVRDPLADGVMLSFFTLKPFTAVSTSGTYNRYVGSMKHNHLIDPKKKKSQRNFLSITLISTLPNATLDAYATAVSVMPKAKAYDFLKKKNLAYIVMENDERLRYSENIFEYVKNLITYDRVKKHP